MRQRFATRLDPYRLLLFLLITIYIVTFYGLAADMHAGMRTHKADLGQIDQAVWNSSRGRFLEQTDNGFVATRLTDHVEPMLVFISPIFWLWNDVRALLLLQAIAVGIGAWILYELSLRQFDKLLSPHQRTQIWQLEPLRNLTRPLALALATAYLLAPQLQSALLTEFHAAPLAVPLILWAFWAVDARRWGQFIAAALLVASVKEEMALLAAGLGVWAIWRVVIREWGIGNGDSTSSHDSQFTKPFLSGLLVLTVSLIWFVVATFVIVPAHAAEVYGVAESGYFQRYGALGDSPVDIFRSFFTQPGLVWQIASEPARIDYLIGLLMPFGFLSLLAPEILLLALPVLLANLLSAYPAQYYGDFHYSAPLVPYFAVAAAYGLGRLWRWLATRTDRTSANFQQMPAAGQGTMAAASMLANSRTAIRPLVTVVLVAWILCWAGWSYLQNGRGPLGARHDRPPITEHHQRLPTFLTQIPDDAAVTATAAVHPHLSHREYIYQFPLGLDSSVPAQWALLDVTTNTDMAPGDLKANVNEMLAGNWGVVDAGDGFLLLSTESSEKSIPDRFYSFVLASGPSAESAVEPADQPLTFVDVEIDDWPRWRQTKLAGLWHVGEGFDPASVAPFLEVRSPAGDTLGSLTDVVPPALVWYPPERWQPGETIRITSLPLYLPKTWGVVIDAAQAPVYSPGAVIGADGQELLATSVQRSKEDRLEQVVSTGRGLAAGSDEKSSKTDRAIFSIDEADGLELQASLPNDAIWPGATIDVQLRWQGAEWPADLSAFVHLRRDGENVSQADGPPRYFVRPPLDGLETADMPILVDWRQLTVPDDQPDASDDDGEWSLVVGLYDPSTGERISVVDGQGNPVGQEVLIGTLRVRPPPVPDQACALIPATCESQTIR